MLINECYHRSVNTERFIEFLQLLKKRLPISKVVLFMDNLSVHRCSRSLDEMAKLGFSPIFNTAYSPEHNPIEMIFSKVKHHFKTIKTNAIVKKLKVDT
jgi:transposase